MLLPTNILLVSQSFKIGFYNLVNSFYLTHADNDQRIIFTKEPEFDIQYIIQVKSQMLNFYVFSALLLF